MKENRGEHRKKWAEQNNIAPKPSMKRRRNNHNYHSRCIYMITIVAENRRPLLGSLKGEDCSHHEPWIMNTTLGDKITTCWAAISNKYPEIKSLAFQVMPDHIHGILFITQEIKIHLGQVIAWFKKESNDLALEQFDSKLWETGFNDVILSGKGQLQRMMDYIHDNPRRLWVKQHNSSFFTIKNNVTVGEWNVATVGNQFLLRHPVKVAVRCSRSINTQEAINKEVSHYMELARNGAVLVSPAISKAEKAVMRAAFDANLKTIVLLENGFSPLWKPGGKQFDACAQGRLLLVAPWQHHNQRTTISRNQCLMLNEIACQIANM